MILKMNEVDCVECFRFFCWHLQNNCPGLYYNCCFEREKNCSKNLYSWFAVSGMQSNYFDLSMRWICSLFPFLYPTLHYDKPAEQDRTKIPLIWNMYRSKFLQFPWLGVCFFIHKTKPNNQKLNATSLGRFFKYWPTWRKVLAFIFQNLKNLT